MNFVSRLARMTAPVRPFPTRAILIEGMELVHSGAKGGHGGGNGTSDDPFSHFSP